MDTRDTDVEMRELAPEEKINMKLDDIIKHEQMRAGVSHNLQFNRRKKQNQNYKGKRQQFRPYFPRRFRSQNWRLRGNGPNTPRWRFPAQRSVGKVRAFLERKWRTTPINSVFQRLGHNPLLATAQNKLWRARNYYKPQRSYYQKKFYQPPSYDPNRVRKLIKSARIHSKREDDGLDGLEEFMPVTTLNEVNLEKLQEVLGGHVTGVKEEKCDNGEVKTTITRYDPSLIDDDKSVISENGSYYGGAMQNGFNQANVMNGYNSFNSMNPMSVNGYNMGVMNGFNMGGMNGFNMGGMNGFNMGGMNSFGMNMNPNFMNNMNANVMNNMNANVMNNMNANVMNNMNANVNGNSMYNMNGYNMNGMLNGMHNNNNMPNGRVQLFNRMNKGNTNNFSTNTNSLSSIINNSDGLSQEQLIQKLNQPLESKPDIDSAINSSWGKGIEGRLPAFATKCPINARFGASISRNSLLTDQ